MESRTQRRGKPWGAPTRSCVALGLAAGLAFGPGCRSRLDVAIDVATERNRVLLRPPKREHFFVRDRQTGRPLEEVSGLYRGDGVLVLDGVQREWYPGGGLHFERAYRQDEPCGLWRSYWTNGALRMVHEHDSDRPTPMVFWHPNGAVAAEGLAIAGRRVGRWITRWPHGALRSEGEYAGGAETGPWILYGEDGEWVERGRFRAGRRVGDWERRAGAADGDPPSR